MHRALEIFWAFLRLGLIAFGGPIALCGMAKSVCVDWQRRTIVCICRIRGCADLPRGRRFSRHARCKLHLCPRFIARAGTHSRVATGNGFSA